MNYDLAQRRSLMTLNEVKDILHVSESTVKKMAARGDIPSVKIGRARRFRPEDISRYISLNLRDEKRLSQFVP
jgi:excisionase family DNA binding protein